MTNKAHHFNDIFSRTVLAYHQHENTAEKRTNCTLDNPYPESSLENLLFQKNLIDNIQWDLEDLIRDPDIVPQKALELKRRIDRSNQDRTDMVEKIDDIFLEKYKSIIPHKDARLNTESMAWALDRLSILAIKVYHMNLQTIRKDSNDGHLEKCRMKLGVLHVQQSDLIRAIDELMEDLSRGTRIVKVYRQMKMYNDPEMNPVLYAQKSKA